MIILLSPSKTLDFETKNSLKDYSLPQFLDVSAEIVKEIKKLDGAALMKMMKISEKLADLNVSRYQNWSLPFDLNNARQAILAFQGDVYRDIKSHDYSKKELDYAQKHVRVLSGLYGYLKALDLIQPYRLEMKYKDKFWRDKVTKALNDEVVATNQPVLNLASREYANAIDFSLIEGDIYNVIFKENKGNQYKIIALYAKIARGTMTNWLVRNDIQDIKKVKNFAEDGYKFSAKMSTESDFVFLRG
jgi:cytoplasmic iron level regulating protein YaaA (DUF328/UPF0246 family)